MVEAGNSSSGPSLPIRFSTDDLLERDRLPVWREATRAMLNCDVTPVGETSFRWEGMSVDLPGASLGLYSGTPYALNRSRGQVADGDDHLMLGTIRSSSMHVEQGPREAFVSTGEAVLWSNGRAGAANMLPDFAIQTVTIPRRILAPAVPDVDALVTSLVPRNSVALQLLSHYVLTLFDHTLAMSPELRAMSATHIQDLVAVTLGATRDATEIAKGRGVRVARLKAIKADIDKHLASRDLSLENIARRHNISPRYVRALFDGEGTSFTDHVLKMRLLRAHAMLGNPASRHVKISTIAFESGFGDLSHFNYAFRRYFGLTPSDARALALRG